MSLVNSFFILLLFQNFNLIKNEYKNNPNCFLYVPEGYNSLQTPDPVTTVDFEYEITNFDSIKVRDYSFTLRVLVALSWMDKRIKDAPMFKFNRVLIVEKRYHHCFWIPRVEAKELKSMEEFDDDLNQGDLFAISTGKILSAKRYRMVVSCSMDLSLYPVDVQKCSIVFRTLNISGFKLRFGSFLTPFFKEDTTSDLTYDVIQAKRYAEYGLKPYSSRLTLEFVFKRRLPLYLMTTYFPSFLVTLVSFTSFWIHPDAVPGRITLGVTCLLALMTQMVSVRSTIMNVNYVTTIDIWFLVCITFVAFSLFEFALSYTLNRNQKINYKRVNVVHPSKVMRIKWKLAKLSTDRWAQITFPSALGCFVVTYACILWKLADDRTNLFIRRNE